MKHKYSKAFIFNIFAFFICGFILPILLFLLFTGPSEIKQISIDKKEITPKSGYAYSVKYPSELAKKDIFFFLKEYVWDDTQSILFENGEPLRKRGLEGIAKTGRGSYFFCLGTLYFSTSDNSDPRTNGRQYNFSGPVKPWFKSSKFLHLAVCVTGLLLVLTARQTARHSNKVYIAAGGWTACIVVALPIFLGSTLYTYMPDIVVNASSAVGDSLWDTIIIGPDSVSYINKSAGRAPGYPFFISKVMNIEPFHKTITPSTPLTKNPDEHPFIAITRAQIALFGLAAFFFGMVLAAFYGIGAAYMGAVVFKLSAYSAINYLGRILSEGVLLPIIIIYCAVMIWSFKRPSRPVSVSLGILFVLALLIHPRSIAYAPILLAPAGGLLISSGKIRSLLKPAAWLGLFIPVVFFLGICSYNKYMYNAFSATPFNGYSSISIALEIADPDDYKYFTDPKVRKFVRRCLESVAESPHRWPDPAFVNYNVWKVAAPLCREMFQGDRRYFAGHKASLSTACNSVLVRAGGILIPKHPDRFIQHIKYSLIQMGQERPLSVGGHVFWLALLFILLITTIFRRNLTAAACSLLMITHYSSMIFTGALQGYLGRYIYTTQWMLPLAAGLFVMDILVTIKSVGNPVQSKLKK
jgi:hypothetical protein